MRMELQGSGWCINFSSGINTTRNIKGCTPGCIFLKFPRLLHEHTVIQTAKYLVSTSTYMDLPDRNWCFITCNVVYNLNAGKVIECYVDANFAIGWTHQDADNAENFMLYMGHVITYVGYPVLWCIKLQT